MGEYYYDAGDYAKARYWYKRAADQGNGKAMNMQGVLRSSEEYGLYNESKAVEYFRQSAEAGYGWGMYHLARCYENGSGVQKNLKLAGEWYAKAADEGIKPAIKWVNGYIIDADVMAELCSVMILGRLKSGRQIWTDPNDLSNQYTYEINSIVSSGEWIRNSIAEEGETVIGGSKNINLISSDEEIIFTDKGVYFRNDSGGASWTPYSGISGVKFVNRGRKSFRISMRNGSVIDLDNASEWDGIVGLTNVRLFLLLIGCLIGNCEYEFTEEELNKLNLVTLESLNNRCIVDYI